MKNTTLCLLFLFTACAKEPGNAEKMIDKEHEVMGIEHRQPIDQPYELQNIQAWAPLTRCTHASTFPQKSKKNETKVQK